MTDTPKKKTALEVAIDHATAAVKAAMDDSRKAESAHTADTDDIELLVKHDRATDRLAGCTSFLAHCNAMVEYGFPNDTLPDCVNVDGDGVPVDITLTLPLTFDNVIVSGKDDKRTFNLLTVLANVGGDAVRLADFWAIVARQGVMVMITRAASGKGKDTDDNVAAKVARWASLLLGNVKDAPDPFLKNYRNMVCDRAGMKMSDRKGLVTEKDIDAVAKTSGLSDAQIDMVKKTIRDMIDINVVIAT